MSLAVGLLRQDARLLVPVFLKHHLLDKIVNNMKWLCRLELINSLPFSFNIKIVDQEPNRETDISSKARPQPKPAPQISDGPSIEASWQKRTRFS